MTSKIKPKNKKKRPTNNRRKARELVMKSVYRGLVNDFDVNQIKLDIKDDPDFLMSDKVMYVTLLDGVFKNFKLLKAEIESYIEREYAELSLSLIHI